MKSPDSRKFSLSLTAVPVILTILLFLSSLFFILIPYFETTVLKQKKQSIKELTQTAVSLLRNHYEEEISGKRTRDQTQAESIQEIGAMRYGPEGKDYFWVIDMEPRMVVHPFRQDLNGQMVDDFEDPEGKKIFMEMVKIAKDSGAGYVDYMWQWKDDSSRIVPKISYVQVFEPWGWIVGTGIYIEDVRAEMDTLRKKVVIGNIIILIFIILISVFIVLHTYNIEKQKIQAESDLHEHLLKQQAVLSAVPDPLIQYDEKGKAQYINGAFTQVFGWSSDELLGSKVDFVPPEEMDKTIHAIKSVYNHPEKPFVFESRRLTKSGDVLDVIISAAVFLDKEGSAAGMVVNLTNITDRKTMEASLKESEEKFRSISNNALDGIIMINPRGEITFFNRAAEKMFGYGSGEVTGKNMHILFAPERYHPDYENGFEIFQRTGRGTAIGRTLEFNAQKKNGMEFPIELSVSSMQFNNEWHAVGILRDISVRKEAERALRESEERFTRFMDNFPGLAFIKTREGYYEYYKQYSKETGFGHLDRTGKTDYEIFPKHVADEYAHNDHQVFNSGEPLEVIEQAELKGLQRYFFVSKFLIRLEGQKDLLGGMCIDITDRVNTEKALQASEQYHRSLFEESMMPMFLQDFSAVGLKIQELKDRGITNLKKYFHDHPDELQELLKSIRILEANQAALDIYQAPELDIGKYDMSKYVLPGEIDHFVEQITVFANGGRIYQGEARNRTLKGETVELIVRKAVVSGHEKDLARIIVSTTDVTELNRSRRERERLENQLRQAQKMEALGTLAGGIAHDFNNILGALFGFTELAQYKSKDNRNVERELSQIMTSAQRARDLVKQILSFSRKAEQEKHLLRISELVNEALKLLRATLPSTIEIRTEIVREDSLVMADATEMHQVIMNLCTNAAHAMMELGGRIFIKIDETEVTRPPDGMIEKISAGRYVSVMIKDSGHGIEPDILSRIFDPYFTTKDIGQGTGLGLSVVHGIVTNHGGGIQVVSEIGKGSEFTVFLPARDDVEDWKEMSAPDFIPKGSERILYVDDEELLTAVGKDLLENLGYDVTVCTSGLEALELILADPDRFDLVITDQTMPGLTGIELAQGVLAVRPKIPIILCTGYSAGLTREKALKTGISDFISKPMTLLSLSQTVRNTLDNSKNNSRPGSE